MNESKNDADNNDGHEQERLRKKLAHAEERLARSERYNEELRTELRLMTEKFLLSKQLDQQQLSSETKSESRSETNRIIKKEELEEIKALSAEFSDYYFDSKSNTYFSRSTGWYYYPESEAFYNPEDKRYYKYDQLKKEYIFMCNLDGTTTITSDEKKKEKFISSNEDLEMEDGEINDDDDCIDISSDSDENNTQSKHVPIKSKRKSLSCMGGKIGQHSNCTVTIPDMTISQIHAEINYDLSRRIYMIQDLLSKNGTFVNGKRLGQLERTPLSHGDEIGLADCCLLVAHIHSNRDVDCEECDGSVNLQQQKPDTGIYANYQAKSSRSSMKSLKRKYGLENGMAEKSVNGQDGQSQYRDRTGERQRNVGSDCPYEKTAAGSALDLPLNDRNKGYQMLERMGWKSGQTLGKSNDSSKQLIEPIEMADDHHTTTRRGLGYG
ncbi:Angiogenic factor with G patch and FHA domains 1 [Dermatophagoides pteronyssinus]|uniref:Angiogenic factor with G patch and FHA domains 1 n=1 Tax=Dermatophagoides pteronyssinus TaxID=6956 RepID=A0ABQ8JHC5_DERPT|nr:Angiogenic factor with G patch and FHA domains 1 [Dermatophagoides pteronyssinus]